MVRTKSGGDSTIRPEFVITGMIFHPSRVQSELLHKYIEQSFVEVTLLPACHREDVWLRALLHTPILSAYQIERRQRGVEMKIEGGGGACLTVEEPGELFAVTEEKLDLKTCGVEFYQHTQATLQRLVPHHGGIQVQMRGIFHGAEVLETTQGLEVDLAVIFAPCPTALWVRPSVEKPTVRVAPQLGDRVQIETDDGINIFLLRIVAVHAMIGDARRQAMPMLAQLLRVEVDPGFFQLSLSGFLSRRRLGDGQGKSAPVGDIHHGERGHLQPAFGTTRTAVEKVPEPERLLTTLRDEGCVMRRDQFRMWGERRHQHPLMKVRPVKRLSELPRDGAFRVGAVATQVAEVDAATQHEDRDEQRGQELPLRLTERGHLLQDVVDNGHRPFPG